MRGPAAEVTRCWRDSTFQNCELRSEIALLEAAAASSSGTHGGSGGRVPAGTSQLLSPGPELSWRLQSPPGWPGMAAGLCMSLAL